MSVPDILDGGAVAGHIPLHAPGPPGQRVQIINAGGSRHVVDGIVGRHDGRQVLVFDQSLVGIEIELAHVAAVHVGAADVAVELTVVREIMLGGRHGLQVFGIRAHQAADESARHLGREEGILAIGLAGASPAGIADRLHHRRPEGQALGPGLEDCPGLVRNGRCHPLRQRGIPGRAQGDAVGEGSRALEPDGGIGAGEHPVQGFAPDIVTLDAEPGDGSHVVPEQALLLLEGQAGNQVGGPLFE